MCEQDFEKDPVFTKEFLETIIMPLPEEDPADEFYSAIEDFLRESGKNHIKF